jgi:uncharacterized protein YcfL
MKYFILIAFIFLVGCTSQEEKQVTIDMINKMTPLTAAQQAEAIKECESNPGWTGKPVTFKEVTLQIRCVER